MKEGEREEGRKEEIGREEEKGGNNLRGSTEGGEERRK